MRFRVESQLRGVAIDVRSLPQTVSVTGKQHHEVTVTFAADTAADSATAASAVACVAEMAFGPSAARLRSFRAMAGGHLPDGSVLAGIYAASPFFLDQAGRINHDVFAVPVDVLPVGLRSFISQVNGELTEAQRRAVSLLRWRIGDRGPHNALGSGRSSWSLDGGAWYPLPLGGSVTVTGTGVPRLTDEVRADLQSFLADGVEAPLAQELWREAWELRGTNPRSALLVGMTALEVGVKQYIQSAVPDATWLIEDFPAPPLDRVLAEYLPKLPGNPSPFPGLSPDEKGTIKKAQHQRNRLAHTGRGEATTQKVTTILEIAYLSPGLCQGSGFDVVGHDVTGGGA